ncbi:MAG: hypothetical protein ACK5N9_17080, partial [Pirellula sp.]
DYSSFVDEVRNWIRNNLPPNYSWPGNIRELEQCARNVLIHGSYSPDQSQAVIESTSSKLVNQIDKLELTADELLALYCQIAYSKTRNFEKAAKLLQLDRRTVRAKIDWLAQANKNVGESSSSDEEECV